MLIIFFSEVIRNYKLIIKEQQLNNPIRPCIRSFRTNPAIRIYASPEATINLSVTLFSGLTTIAFLTHKDNRFKFAVRPRTPVAHGRKINQQPS